MLWKLCIKNKCKIDLHAVNALFEMVEESVSSWQTEGPLIAHQPSSSNICNHAEKWYEWWTIYIHVTLTNP